MNLSEQADSDIVAYACASCEMAMEINFLDTSGDVMHRYQPKGCMLCGGPVTPLTKAQYEADYGSDEEEPVLS